MSDTATGGRVVRVLSARTVSALVIASRPYRLHDGHCAQRGSQRVAAEGAGTRATRAGAIAPPLTQ